MAKQKKESRGIGFDLPEGFEILSTDKVWVRPSPGLNVRGIVIGHEEREGDDGRPRHDTQIRLTADTEWQGEEGPHPAVIGEVVTVTITATLAKLATAPIGTEVIVQWGEKVAIGGGQSVWRTTLAARSPTGGRSGLAGGQPTRAIGPGSVAQRIADLERALAEAQGDPPF